MTNPTRESTAGALRLEERQDGQVWLVRDGSEDVAVHVRRPFPWSAPDRYISLRGEEDAEVALVDHLDRLDDASRGVLERALAEVSFVLEIQAIESIETEFEIRNWKVRTRQGPYTFQTKHDEWPRTLAAGGLLLRDVEGNLFRIGELETLDDKSQELLWAFTD